MALVLPIRAVVAVLGCLAVAELALLPRTSSIGAHVAVHVVVLGSLLLLPRRPLTILALLLLEIFLVKELRLNAMVSVSLALLAPFAAFAAAALVAPWRLWIVALLLAAHLGWRATLPSGDAPTLLVTATLLASAALAGALLQRSQRRLTTIEAERDRLRAALAGGPGEAATAEQLRMWGEVEQRIAPVIAGMPALVRQAAEGRTRERLESVREQAREALRAMQTTVRMLGAAPPEAATPWGGGVARSPHAAVGTGPRRRVAPSPLALTCAALTIAALSEHAVRGLPPLALLPAVALPLIPLLVPRAPVGAALAFGAGLTAASLTGLIGVVAVTYDLVALLLIVLSGALAGPRRAAAAFLILQAGAAAALAADDAMSWPAVSYVSQALLLTGGWSVGALLRGVAVEQRRVAAGVAEVAQALDELVRQAIQRERVRLAHELHDLVGHALTAVALQASAALVQLDRGRPVELEPLLHAATQGVAELERLAAVLEPPGSVAEELERMAAACGQRVVLELPERIELDDDLRRTVVGVAAEALTNAAKHAAGAPIRVSLTHTGDALALRVVDEGGAASGLPSGGNGIASMARRVQAVGGTFVSGPRPGGGWVVSAVLPGDTIARRG